MKTSKKLIALVLFVAMMLMMVPAANAAAITGEGELRWVLDGTASYEISFESSKSHWFIGPDDQPITGILSSGGLTSFVPPTSALKSYTGIKVPNIKSGVALENSTKGVITADSTSGTSYNAAPVAGGTTGSATFELTGKYSNLTPYRYTQFGAAGAAGTVFKVPFRVYKVETYKLQVKNDDITPDWVDAKLDGGVYVPFVGGGDAGDINVLAYAYTDVTALTSVDGLLAGSTYLPSASDGIIYYLDYVLDVNGNNTTKRVTVNDGSAKSFDVTVKYSNTSTTAATTFELKVQGKDGEQKANFNVVSQTTGKDYNNILYFDIAKRTKADNTDIGSISYVDDYAFFAACNVGEVIPAGSFYYQISTASNGVKTAMQYTAAAGGYTVVADVSVYKLKAGTTYTDATVVNAYNSANQGKLLTSDNVMTVKLQAINADGSVMPYGTTFTATVGNLSANAIAVSDTALLRDTERYGLLGSANTTFFLDADGCFTLNLYGIQSWQAINSTTISYYSEKMMTIAFEFKNGTTTIGKGTYDIVFRNVERTSSSITVLESEMLLEVGETATLQFVLNDETALNKGVEWKSVNKSVVKVTSASTGKIEALSVGTALIYCEDAAGNSHVVTVTVVEDKSEPVPGDEPGGEPTDEDGANYVVTASSLNVRKGPGTSYGKVGSLKRGSAVTVIGESGSWMQIEAVSGFKAADKYYVSGKYLALAD